jgi:predicted DNA-binding protein
MVKKGRQKEFEAYITVRCTEATYAELAELARNDNRPMSNYVRIVLDRHVEVAKATAKEAEPQAA